MSGEFMDLIWQNTYKQSFDRLTESICAASRIAAEKKYEDPTKLCTQKVSLSKFVYFLFYFVFFFKRDVETG